ncbi:MAG: class I SAM-dependent methyltransferase [Gammaproteobacteria bacterium]|nr:class I SAM-dependent methyltransferase [Gammaproteobacteria bacterium]MDE0189730.1 class I SAM-dependent methyltransferase [Gammaproteobacteria bacterium]
MSKENDQGTLDAEFERLRVISGRVARDPGGVGMDVENLPDFFNNVAHLWDAKFAEGCAPLHRATATRVARTREPVRILDVGCGTGLELEYILERAPNARITAMDQAPRMLAELERKYVDRMPQIELLEASCVDWPAGLKGFDYVVSILCVHHFPPDTKREIYRCFQSALGPNGAYVEGDQCAGLLVNEEETSVLRLFEDWIAKLPGGSRGEWNYDVTLSAETNQRLLREAGFTRFAGPWLVDGDAVLVARP